MKITHKQLRVLISEAWDLGAPQSTTTDPRLDHIAEMGWTTGHPKSTRVAYIELPSDNRVSLFIDRVDKVWYLAGWIGHDHRSMSRNKDVWLANPYTVGGDRLIYNGYMNTLTELFLSLDQVAEMLQTKEGATQAIDLMGSMLTVSNSDIRTDSSNAELLDKVERNLGDLLGVNS